MKQIILIVLAIAALTSCKSTETTQQMEHNSDSLAKLTIFTECARGFEVLELLEGLPHQAFEKEILEKEIKEKSPILIHGFWFYEQPLDITTNDDERLREMLSDESIYLPYSGMKRCGGFHPDYSIRLLNKSEVAYFHICFGCQEIKAYLGKTWIHADLSGDTFETIKELLQSYNRNRPNRN